MKTSGGNDLWFIAPKVAPKANKVLNTAVNAGQTWRSHGRQGLNDVWRNGQKTLKDEQRNGANNSESVRKKNVLGYPLVAKLQE